LAVQGGGGGGDIGIDQGHASGGVQPAGKGDGRRLGKGHLRDAHYGNLRGTRSGGPGAHADGADPAAEVSGLTSVRGHSYRGSGRVSMGGDM
jgi:hypothetical protein